MKSPFALGDALMLLISLSIMVEAADTCADGTAFPCNNFVIRDVQSGLVWKYDAASDSIYLDTDGAIVFSVDPRPDTYQSDQGYIALVDRDTGNYLRHSYYLLRLNSFEGDNYDFGYKPLIQADDTVIFQNDFGGGYSVGYDETRNEVLIVPDGDPAVRAWILEPLCPYDGACYTETGFVPGLFRIAFDKAHAQWMRRR
jgi:hypothetical protein